MTDPEQTTASKRQEAEGQTLADQKYLDAVLAHSHDGISLRVVDEADGFHRIVFCNDRYVEMSGYTRTHLMVA